MNAINGKRQVNLDASFEIFTVMIHIVCSSEL